MPNVEQINDFKKFLIDSNIKYASVDQPNTDMHCIVVNLGNGGFSNTDTQINFVITDIGFVTFMGPLCKIKENKLAIEVFNCNRINQEATLYEKFYIDEDDCLCMKAVQDFTMKNQMSGAFQDYSYKYFKKDFIDKFLDSEIHYDWR